VIVSVCTLFWPRLRLFLSLRDPREGISKKMPPAAKGSAATKSAKKKPSSNAAIAKKVAQASNAEMDEDIYQEPIKKIVRPANQLQLTEQELKEEHTRVLTANDPNVPNNISKYNYKDRTYKMDPPGPGDHLAMHFSIDGSALHVDSDDAKAQEAYESKKREDEDEARKAAQQAASEAGEDDVDVGSPGGKNQFDYSERAAQTFNYPMVDRGVATEPPPMVGFASTVAQWEIHDAYLKDYAVQMAEAEADGRRTGGERRRDAAEAPATGRADDDDMVHSAKMGGALKILERMVNQNAEASFPYCICC
ncbi:unnamed protein product, partial [Phaeothamnion confervicola]